MKLFENETKLLLTHIWAHMHLALDYKFIMSLWNAGFRIFPDPITSIIVSELHDALLHDKPLDN